MRKPAIWETYKVKVNEFFTWAFKVFMRDRNFGYRSGPGEAAGALESYANQPSEKHAKPTRAIFLYAGSERL